VRRRLKGFCGIAGGRDCDADSQRNNSSRQTCDFDLVSGGFEIWYDLVLSSLKVPGAVRVQ